MYDCDEGGFPFSYIIFCYFIYIFTKHSGYKNVYIWSVILTKQAAIYKYEYKKNR